MHSVHMSQQLSYLRPTLARAPIDETVARLTDGYSHPYQDRQIQHGDGGRAVITQSHPGPKARWTFVCAHAGDGRPYLAPASKMQSTVVLDSVCM